MTDHEDKKPTSATGVSSNHLSNSGKAPEPGEPAKPEDFSALEAKFASLRADVKAAEANVKTAQSLLKKARDVEDHEKAILRASVSPYIVQTSEAWEMEGRERVSAAIYKETYKNVKTKLQRFALRMMMHELRLKTQAKSAAKK